ncbi:MAG: DNA polymerase III subunit delta [Aggregatilineales bacterium]
MSTKQSATFYIFHGDDGLSITEAVKKLRTQMGTDSNAELNISEFDGTSASVPEIINAVSSYPFLADKRMALVKGLLTHITRKGAGETGKRALQQLAESLPTLPEYARLILIEQQNIPDNNAAMKVALSDPHGYVKKFTTPKDITRWIKQRAETDYNVQIDNRAVSALAAVVGNDMRLADNELVKLASYVEQDVPISEADVATLTPYVPEANIFKMVDAIAEGRGQLALELLHRLLSDKNQNPFSIFSMITRQFRLLLLAKEHLITGGAPGSIAGAIGVSAFVAQNLARQSRAFDVPELERIYRALQDYDFRMKIGGIKPDLALDLFIASVTG